MMLAGPMGEYVKREEAACFLERIKLKGIKKKQETITRSQISVSFLPPLLVGFFCCTRGRAAVWLGIFLSKGKKKKSKGQVKMIISFIYYHYPSEKVESLPFIFLKIYKMSFFHVTFQSGFQFFFQSFHKCPHLPKPYFCVRFSEKNSVLQLFLRNLGL